MCDIDEPGRKTSSSVSPNAAAALAIIQRSVPCVWVTPFAGPVLPEVKKIAAGSSSPRTPNGSVGGSPANRSSSRVRPSSSSAEYQIVPSRMSPASALSAMSPARSSWATIAAAPLTPRAWSISRAV